MEYTEEEKRKEVYDSYRDIFKHFDRIHDRLFTFNNMMFIVYLGFGKFPSDEPIIDSFLWAAIPVLNSVFLIVLENYNKETSRHCAGYFDWKKNGAEDSWKIIREQRDSWAAILSLIAIILTAIVLITLAILIII